LQNISLLFIKKTAKSVSIELFSKIKDKPGAKRTMAAVLIGPKEVLVIVIVTAIVVFVAMVRRRRR
jgi:hypothetical protein